MALNVPTFQSVGLPHLRLKSLPASAPTRTNRARQQTAPALSGGSQGLFEASDLNARAIELGNAGRYSEAEPLYEQSLAIREKVLGPNHPEVAASLNNLVLLYGKQGRYSEAIPLAQRALTIDEKEFGPDRPEVATLLNNLAELYRAQGRYADAEPFFKRSLAIREKVLGPDHLDVAASLNNLAGLISKPRSLCRC